MQNPWSCKPPRWSTTEAITMDQYRSRSDRWGNPPMFSVNGDGKRAAAAVTDDGGDALTVHRHRPLPLQLQIHELTPFPATQGTSLNEIYGERGKRSAGSTLIDGGDHKQSVHSTAAMKQSRKRQRSSTPICQVQGCNADLRAGKEYHRRHRVCEMHSKATKVVASGLEQRFCQQCSRFHVLSEFDEGKRSCRRRLAGHNERRRKSQLESLPPNRAGSPSTLPDRNIGGFPDLAFPLQKTEELSAGGSAFTSRQSQYDVTVENGRKILLRCMGTGNLALPSTDVELASGLDSVRALSLLSSQSNICTIPLVVDNNFSVQNGALDENSLRRGRVNRLLERHEGLQEINGFECTRCAACLDTLKTAQNSSWNSFAIPSFQCSESLKMLDLSCSTSDIDLLP